MKRKIIRTEADLLEHSYNKIEEAKPISPSSSESPPPPTEPAPSPMEPVLESAVDNTALVTKLMDSYTKADLVKLAESNGVDSNGTKIEIAIRLIEAGLVEEF